MAAVQAARAIYRACLHSWDVAAADSSSGRSAKLMQMAVVAL
jgi:hypothetical protein